MWKKTVILIFALCLCLFTAACGSSDNGTDGAGSAGAASSAEGSGLEKTGEIGSFTTTDLNGNEVTEAVFAEKDMTVLHIWGSFCGPCINEMPEVAEFAKGLPENAQFIGVVCDVSEAKGNEYEDALDILKDSGAEFPNLITGGGLEDVLGKIQYVPTTIIVDKDGNVIGTPIVGAGVSQYESAAQKYLDSIS